MMFLHGMILNITPLPLVMWRAYNFVYYRTYFQRIRYRQILLENKYLINDQTYRFSYI